MSQNLIHHPVDLMAGTLDLDVYDSSFQIFKHICLFWGNLDEPEAFRSRLYSFMENRMKLRPEYRTYYKLAMVTMKALSKEIGEDAAYQRLFTLNSLLDKHNNDPLAITRQKVSNEFITFQVDQGGFKTFGPKNTTGYIGGAFIEGQKIPYRTMEG